MTFTPLSLLSLVTICHYLCSCCNKVAAQGPADDGAIQHIDLVLPHQETNTEIPHDVMEDFDRQRAICQLPNSSSRGRATYHRGSTSSAPIHSTSQHRQRGRTPPLLEHHTPPFRPRVAETSTKHAPPLSSDGCSKTTL